MRRLFKTTKSVHLQPRSAQEKNIIYAIGDIHGRHDLLLRLIDLIRTDIDQYIQENGGLKKITLIFLGDYIDRGLNSKNVIETLINLDVFGAKRIFLKGNHEAVLLDFLENPDFGLKWAKYGGRETLASYGIDLPLNLESYDRWDDMRNDFLNVIPPYHLLFLRNLQTYQIQEQYMFVHAGIDPDQDAESQTEEEYLWVRDKFLKNKKKLPYVIVHGHTPESRPVWDGRRIGIDTGAYISNTLTAAKLTRGSVEFLLT